MSTIRDNQPSPTPNAAGIGGAGQIFDLLNSRLVYASVSIIILLSVFYLQGRLLAEVDQLYLRKDTFQTHQEQDSKFQSRTEQSMVTITVNRVSLARIESDISAIKTTLEQLQARRFPDPSP